jgi:NADH:ubiquinone oxidoreductase subunit 3 (subunit A)
MQPYLGHIALYAIVALAMPAGIVALVLGMTRWLKTSRTAGPRARVASDTYESGMVPVGDAWVRFHVQYYMYALVFVVFDVEVVFLYPWAVVFRQVGLFALAEISVFIFILVLGLAYAWRRGALKWT